MEEKIYKTGKNGMAVLILTILLYAAAIAGMILSGIGMENGGSTTSTVVFVVSCVWMCVGFIPTYN